jgi:hypothetical protein
LRVNRSGRRQAHKAADQRVEHAVISLGDSIERFGDLGLTQALGRGKQPEDIEPLSSAGAGIVQLFGDDQTSPSAQGQMLPVTAPRQLCLPKNRLSYKHDHGSEGAARRVQEEKIMTRNLLALGDVRYRGWRHRQAQEFDYGKFAFITPQGEVDRRHAIREVYTRIPNGRR